MSRRRRTRRYNALDIVCRVVPPVTFLMLIVVHLWAAGFDGTSFR